MGGFVYRGGFLKMRLFHLCFAVVAGACISNCASAALVLTITQTGNPLIVVTDNGAGDINSAPDTITWQENNVSGLTFSLVTGVSNNPGNATQGTLSQTQVDITNGSLSSMTIEAILDDSGFTNPLGTRTLLSNITATFSGVLTGN